MADSFEQFEVLLRETIDDRVLDLTLDTDDVAWNLMETFMPQSTAGKTNDGSAGWMAEWRIRVQRAGRVAGGKFTGNTINTMGTSDLLNMGQAADALYLDPAHSPLRSYLPIRMSLKRVTGNLTVNTQQILADLASTPIEQVGGDYIEDAVSLVRLLACDYFWSDGSAALAQVNMAAGASITETAGGVEVTIDAGTFARFAKGMRIVAGSNVAVANYGSSDRTARTGTTSSNPAGVMRVVNIDVENRTIWLESEPGEGTVALSDNDQLMVEGTFDWAGTTVTGSSLAAEGVESLLLDSGTFPGTSFSVAAISELKSFVDGSESSLEYPTPEKLALLIDKITDAGKMPPSVLISEQSVKTLYAQQEREAGAYYSVPQGAGFMASGGISGARFQHGDKVYAWLTSSMVRPGAVVGLSPETWKKFMPIGGKTIRWVMTSPPINSNSIFRPVTSGRQLSELHSADFDFFIQFGCTDPRRNLRRIGFYSQRDV